MGEIISMSTPNALASLIREGTGREENEREEFH